MKKGWQIKNLGEICSFLNRGISPRYLDRGGICVLNQKCIRDHRVSYEPSRRHDARAKKVGSERLIQAGDVLVNSTGTGTLGRVAQLREAPPEPTTVDSHVTIVRPTPGKFYPEFFGYMLVVIEDAIKEAGEGCGGQTELARSVLAEKFPVHYPESLPEQQRIVGILDEAFEGIATAKANAEKNLQNARALFESHLQSVFTERGEGWKQKTLEEIATTFGRGKSKHRPRNEPKLYGGKYPFIQTGDIRNADHFITEYFQTYSEAGLAQSKLWPKGTICITIAANIAETAILGFDACFPDSVVGVVANPKEAEGGFIEYLLQSFKARIQALGKGSAQAIAKFEQEGLILTDRRRNRLAWDILSVFSSKVDDLREKLKKAQNVGTEQDLYRQYLLTVMQATDEVNQRRLRESTLRGLLESLFAKKDAQRGFSNAQRRIIWNTTADRRCQNPKCKKRLAWGDFTIDHIDPYSKGGRTRLQNAALMCRSCNSAKGKR